MECACEGIIKLPTKKIFGTFVHRLLISGYSVVILCVRSIILTELFVKENISKNLFFFDDSCGVSRVRNNQE